MGFAVRKDNLAADDILKGGKKVLGSRISHVFAIGHEIVQSPVSFGNSFAAGPFDENEQLKRDFEQQQERLDPSGGVKVHRLNAEAAFRPAMQMLGFVLILVRDHGRFDGKCFFRHVGHKRIPAATLRQKPARRVRPPH